MNLNLITKSPMMRKASVSFLALFAGVSSAYSTIQYTSTSFSGTYSNVVGTSMTLIPNATGYSALGVFSADPATLNTPAQLAGAFMAFASGAFGGANVANDPGSYSVTGAVTNPTMVAVPGGAPLYLVYGNQATLALSTEFAVVNSGSVTPVNNPDPAIASFSVNLPAALANGSVVYGNVIPVVPSPTFDGQLSRGTGTLQLVVPEPSAGLLLLGSVGALVVRRRRR